MPDEFFSPTEAHVRRPLPLLNARCDSCGLYRNCRSPRMRVDGEGRRGILVVGEYPGSSEDERGRPLIGGTGRFTEAEFKAVGIDMRRDCWLTNAQICFDAKKAEPKTVVADCRPNLLRTIRELNPTTIVLMGGMAVQSLIGHLWKSDCGGISRWTGRRIPNHNPNCWIAPVNNPAFLLKDKADPVAKLQFREHLRAATQPCDRPWPDGPPDYESRITVIHSPTEATQRLRKIRKGPIVVDIEATGLKPDGPTFEIVCAAVSIGTETLAFPWHGPVISTMKEMLTDPDYGWIAQNLKYESRAFRAKLGIEVANWCFDTMIAAHLIDPRRGKTSKDGAERGAGTTGLKYFAYAFLGVGDYNGHLESFLESVEPGGNAPNRVRDIKLDQLLRYCGMDALLEWELAQIQSRQLGIVL